MAALKLPPPTEGTSKVTTIGDLEFKTSAPESHTGVSETISALKKALEEGAFASLSETDDGENS